MSTYPKSNLATGGVTMAETQSSITKVQELIYELRIPDVMTPDVTTVSPGMTMRELKEVLRLEGISGAPVLDRGEMVGIISLEDLIRALDQGALDAPVESRMTRQVVTVQAEDSVIEAVRRFAHHGVGRLPVVDRQGRLVGILTAGDITQGLLAAIQLDYHADEISRYRASHIFQDIVSDQTSLILRYRVQAGNLNRRGQASDKIKRALARLGASPADVRRVGIAAYEAEMNLIIHATQGGELVMEILPDEVRLAAIDRGPGIEDVDRAMQPSYSTAAEWIRDLGFGDGMGLSHIQRCADDMKLRSTWGVGTRLDLRFRLVPRPEET